MGRRHLAVVELGRAETWPQRLKDDGETPPPPTVDGAYQRGRPHLAVVAHGRGETRHKHHRLKSAGSARYSIHCVNGECAEDSEIRRIQSENVMDASRPPSGGDQCVEQAFSSEMVLIQPNQPLPVSRDLGGDDDDFRGVAPECRPIKGLS